MKRTLPIHWESTVTTTSFNKTMTGDDTLLFSALEESFAVKLSFSGISTLLREAEQAYRIPELLSIHAPRDLFRYIQLIPNALPPAVEAKRQRHFRIGQDTSWLSLDEFTRWFNWGDPWDGPDPVDGAWLGYLDSDKAFRATVLEWLGLVRQTQARLRSSDDPLIRYEVTAWDEGRHPEAWELASTRLCTAPDYRSPVDVSLNPDGLNLLAEWLRTPELRGVSLRGLGRYPLVQALCREKLRRKAEAPSAPFNLSTLASHEGLWGARTSPYWSRLAGFMAEGLVLGDLHIEDASSHITLSRKQPSPKARWLVLVNDHGERSAEYEWHEFGEMAFGRRHT